MNSLKNLKIFSDDQKQILQYEIVHPDKNKFPAAFYDKYYHYIANDELLIWGMGSFIIPSKILENNDSIEINIDSSIKNIFFNWKSYFKSETNRITLDAKSLEQLLIIASNELNFLSRYRR